MEGETSREEEEAQAQVDIWKYVFGFVDMVVLKCAIELGIPDALEARDSPTTLLSFLLPRMLLFCPPPHHEVLSSP